VAVDTPTKRRAVSGVPFLPLGPGVTPTADGGINWRAAVAWGYAVTFIEVAVPPITDVVLDYPHVREITLKMR
jgi:hypothetical protein